LKDGCPLNEAEANVTQATELTRERWDVVKKFSAPLTYRNKILVKLAKDRKIKGQLSKANVKTLVTAISQGEIELSSEELIDLSSFNVIEAAKRGLSITSKGFKDILLGKNLLKSVKLIKTDQNSDIIFSILDENLSILFSKDPPNYKKFLVDDKIIVQEDSQDKEFNKDNYVPDELSH
jgi:hypothetical protein